MARRTASHAQARTRAQATSGTPERKETAPFFARRILPDDPTVLETEVEVQQQQVAQIQHNEDLRTVYLLSQEFVIMLKERQAEALDSWLKRAKACHVTELSSFVNGIRRDYAAVEAAFRLPWNNGIVEGH